MRRRRALALCAAVLWLLGVEVLPNVHLAFHHDDHTHALDGTILLVESRHAEHHLPGTARDAHRHAHAHHDHHHHAAAAHGDDHHHHAVIDAEPFAVTPCDGAPTAPPASVHPHDHEVADHDHHHHHDGDFSHSGEFVIDVPAHGHAALGIAHRASALFQPDAPLHAPVAEPRAETWVYPAPIERTTPPHARRPTARGPPAA